MVGFKKTNDGYSGWYAPSAPGNWEIQIALSDQERAHVKHISVNGVTTKSPSPAALIRLRGESKAHRRLDWTLSLK